MSENKKSNTSLFTGCDLKKSFCNLSNEATGIITCERITSYTESELKSRWCVQMGNSCRKRT